MGVGRLDSLGTPSTLMMLDYLLLGYGVGISWYTYEKRMNESWQGEILGSFTLLLKRGI